MNKELFSKIINEELSEFDFLGNDEHLKEEEENDLLKNDEFQRQFIVDSLLNRNKINIEIKDSTVDGDWEKNPNSESKLTIEYIVGIEYEYDKNNEPIKFELVFSCDNVDIKSPLDGDSWLNTFEWENINVDLLTINGDEIKFKTFEKSPKKIKNLFVREFIKDYVEDVMDIKNNSSKTKNDIQNISHV